MTLLLAVVTLVWAVPAAAGGLNFAWGTGCWSENPVASRTFACNTNVGSFPMLASFVLSQSQPDFCGVETVVDLQAAAPTLPAWWQFYNQGSCRSLSLSASAEFTGAPKIACVDPWNGLAAGGIAAYQTTATTPPVPSGLPNAARLKVVYALAEANPLAPGIEYYAWRVSFNAQKTVGTPACAGCATSVCIVLNSIKAAPRVGTSETVSTPIANQALSWQSVTPCGQGVPARNTTWGLIKGLYR